MCIDIEDIIYMEIKLKVAVAAAADVVARRRVAADKKNES